MSNVFKLHVKIKFWRAAFLGCKDVRWNEISRRKKEEGRRKKEERLYSQLFSHRYLMFN
ncbi:hypothetical protein [Phormidium nigroviride]